ncbi:hypothetical protein IFM89_034465 [Coptis chinensis]|uniref:F-box domain-containing protein n=1 Tax=Coptis chinensis TaxID=261450 RepID=A0A835MK16_9MAGN|nr:hypothetical protein IFM89_034465 [Coptis chinensis]
MASAIVKKLRGLHHDMHRKSNDLPDEVVLEILLYLAAEHLQICKSVSGLWSTLISNPKFVYKHLIRSQQHSEIEKIFYTTIAKPGRNSDRYNYRHYSIDNRLSDLTPRKLQLPHPAFEENVLCLQASCDGLLLFKNMYDPKQLYISNPVTAQFMALPPVKDSGCQWALVRDNSIGRYKVFGVMAQYSFCVVTLGENGPPSFWDWHCFRREKVWCSAMLSQPILIKKELHWFSTDEDGEGPNLQPCYCICSVDIEKLCSRRTNVPLQLLTASKRDIFEVCNCFAHHLLSEVNGSLCLTFVSHHQLQMFILEDVTNCAWTKSITISLQSLYNLPLGSFLTEDNCLVSMTGVNSSNLLDLVKVLIHFENELFLYDVKSQELKQIGRLSKKQKLSKLYFCHSNSLVSCG